jgi:hypothetical protein
VLKIINLNGSSLQIRSKQRATSASTQKCGTSFFELSAFQPSTISKLATCECMSHISAQLTMIILQLSHGLALISSCADRREAISEKSTFKLKIQLFVFVKNLFTPGF